GQPQLENQTRSAATQRRRVSGRAALTTKKTGGRNVSRPALRLANAAQTQELHGDRDSHAQPGRRREYGDLQHRQRRVAATSAFRRAGAAAVVWGMGR